MDKVLAVLKIIIPIFVVIFLGILAKKKNMISSDENKGLQQFVMKFGLPCVLFNSCLTSQLGVESLTTMVVLLPLMLMSCFWSFKSRNKYEMSNLPMMFSSQESGMLGIPLFMTLFGASEAYRMGILDMSQSLIAIPVIAILSTDTNESSSVVDIIKEVFKSPLLLMSLLGLFLNLSGIIDVLNGVGVGQIITETTSFVSTPVSAVILFSVGYNFNIGKGNRKKIVELCCIHFVVFMANCLAMQAVLLLLGDVQPETRWAILLFCSLPSSYLSPSLAKQKDASEVASSVCSLLTVVCLTIFCIMTVIVK